MAKLRRIELDKSYKAIDISFLKLGDRIEFDCYIQRFNDFVIIIAAGSTLSEQDFKLLSNSDRHFVKYKEYELYKKIVPKESVSEAKKQISLAELDAGDLEKISDQEQRIEVLYSSLLEVMYGYFDRDEAIELAYIDALLYHYILIIKKDPHIYKTIVNSMCKKNNHAIHSVNVALLSLGLANYFSYSVSQMKILAKAALLHDVGEKEIDKAIFEKNTKLNPLEFAQMKRHPLLSYQRVKDMGVSDKALLDAILHHHEYLDGTGYPDGLMRQRISDFTQIITVCDIFDGMTSYRSYRNKQSAIHALKIIKSEYKEKIRSRFTEGLIKLFHSIYSGDLKN